MSKIRNYGILGLIVSWSCISLIYGRNPIWLFQDVDDPDYDFDDRNDNNKKLQKKKKNKKFNLSDSENELDNKKKNNILKELNNLNLDNLNDDEIAKLYRELKKKKILD